MSEEILCADNLHAIGSVRHSFFTREWGDVFFSGGGMPPHVLNVRARMAEHLGVTEHNALFCRQIHSPGVVVVRDAWSPADAPQADAMVTNRPGFALAILTADCVPVLFAASNAQVIGAAHAGWRGALSGVLENTIKAMEELGAERKYIHAALGPSIAQKSYEVGPEFPAAFLAEDEENKRFFEPSLREGRLQFDLKGYVAAKLRGIGAGSVEISSADTCADPNRFFSYRYSTLRGEKHKGRLVSAIAA